MARKGKLLVALDAHKGRDIEAEKRRKQVKEAEKTKRAQAGRATQAIGDSIEADVEAEVSDDEDLASDGEDEGIRLTSGVATNGANHPDEEDDLSDEEAEDSDVPLSDVSASDLEDTIPHQRLTINNGPALLASQSRIALLRKQPSQKKTPFHIHNSLISDLPASSTAIPDANDDLTRELEFYRIARTAALAARKLLKSESVAFTRPADYFAEMVKSDMHMDKIKNKMRVEAADKKGRQEARRQRDAKKFGKQVQIAKEQERAKSKRDILDKVKDLKRKRKNNPTEDVREKADDDLFESISIENPSVKSSSGRERGGGGSGRGDRTNFKRQKKDSKFGFGGKKRFSKSGDAVSAGDMSGFSSSRMKGRGGRGGAVGGGGRGGAKRLGKSRRMAAR